MALFNIKEKDFSIIINEMEQDIENVDPISFIKAYHIRSIIPTYIHLIEKLLGFCPKSWFKDIKSIAYEIAERQIEEAKEMALPPQLYDILEKNQAQKYSRQSEEQPHRVDFSVLAGKQERENTFLCGFVLDDMIDEHCRQKRKHQICRQCHETQQLCQNVKRKVSLPLLKAEFKNIHVQSPR